MKLEKKALGMSIYLFIVSFFTERLWFNSDYLNIHNAVYIIICISNFWTSFI